MSFKTQQEIWEYLIGGGKVKGYGWDNGIYVFLDKGVLKKENGTLGGADFIYPENWQPYKEPQKTKKFYLWLMDGGNGAILERSFMCEDLMDTSGDSIYLEDEYDYKRKLKETEIELPVNDDGVVQWDLVEDS